MASCEQDQKQSAHLSIFSLSSPSGSFSSSCISRKHPPSPPPSPPPAPPPPSHECISRILDKKPEYRSKEDQRVIFKYLQTIKALRHFHPHFLQQMCSTVYYEFLSPGIVLYYQGNPALNWYTVLSGTLQIAQSTTPLTTTVTPPQTTTMSSPYASPHYTLTHPPPSTCAVSTTTSSSVGEKTAAAAVVTSVGSLCLGVDLDWGREVRSKRNCERRSEEKAKLWGGDRAGVVSTVVVGYSEEKSQCGGTSSVRVEEQGKRRNSLPYCTLLTDGSVFGESSLGETHRNHTVVTIEECQLLYMDQRDYRALWQENQDFLQDLHISSRETNILIGNDVTQNKSVDGGVTFPNFSTGGNSNTIFESHSPLSSPAPPVSPQHHQDESMLQRGASISRPEGQQKSAVSEELLYIGTTLYETIHKSWPSLINTSVSAPACGVMLGSDMVTWMCNQISMDDRQLALGMWQALLEEGVVLSLDASVEMCDDSQYYCFTDSVYTVSETFPTSTKPTNNEGNDLAFESALNFLKKVSSDSLFRMILRKPSKDRQPHEIEFIFGELLHIQALSHLSTTVKRQLASVLIFEAHAIKGKALFRQGDEGVSWYIILKGSVHVYIQGKGVVCTLHEGDDFGNLALVNNAPRAATIILREKNCHFLRVDKNDFNHILRDVEANTVRLKEHGTDVLILEKISTAKDNSLPAKPLYSVKAGTAEKILEHLLETRLDLTAGLATILNNTRISPDVFVEDFVLTYPIFLSTRVLCDFLSSYLKVENPTDFNEHTCSETDDPDRDDIFRNKRRRVIYFLFWWYRISSSAFIEDTVVLSFTEELKSLLQNDCKQCPSLKSDIEALDSLQYTSNQDQRDSNKRHSTRNRMSFKQPSSPKTSIQITERPKLRPADVMVVNIFNDRCESTSLKLPLGSTVKEIIKAFHAQTGCTLHDICLAEIRPDGEKLIFNETDTGIITRISVNGRLFIVNGKEIKNLQPLLEQTSIPESTLSFLEVVKVEDLAMQITLFDWELFQNVQFYELIYQVFGRVNFDKTTGNLDLVIREFSVVQFWVVTELCLISALNKRVAILKCFIKLASKLLLLKNMNSFFAVMLGLSNSAVSRMYMTWDKLPNKYSKLFTELSCMLDPSRNHRVFRQTLDKTSPPIIPFLALLLKDMTFTHEGNKTKLEANLINFEKMELIARNLRVLINCRSKPLHLDVSTSREKSFMDIKSYVRQLRCIDDQRVLTDMSKRLEPRKGGGVGGT